jgi:predicted RNA-binding protein with PUA-like domain
MRAILGLPEARTAGLRSSGLILSRRLSVSYWLLKSEPHEYSFDDLVRDQVSEWDGVTANPAQAQMRQMRVGDLCVIYHTGDERRAVGQATVVRDPYPDPTDASGKRVWVDLRVGERLQRPVTLAELKASPAFSASPLLRMSRLSVVPLTPEQLAELQSLARRKDDA